MNLVDVLLGLQWGDEGKGKIVDFISKKYDLIGRFQGGPNAGHTIIFNNQKFVLHTIPSGIFNQKVQNIIGNGVVIDPVTLCAELDMLEKMGVDYTNNLYISRKAHLIIPTHKHLDAASEIAKGKNKIGSTLRGITPTYMDKTGRNGLRIGDCELDDFETKFNNLINKHKQLLTHYNYKTDFADDIELWFKSIKKIKTIPFINSEYVLNDALSKSKKILAEGAQGTLLDIDFGTYPFVTSSNTISSGACNGLGIAPNTINNVIGIFKAYCTRVGSGPFPTEINNEIGKMIAEKGNEFGSTTGRASRCGWIDLPALKYAIQINGVTELSMMKADVLSGFEYIHICTGYKYMGKEIQYLPYSLDTNCIEPIYIKMKGWKEDISKLNSADKFPTEFSDYINFLEKKLNKPISIISVGPDRKQTIFR
ncbi:MAG: adenylosuccinate synthase [Flavobacteriales bacterium]|nr:adenylosuccinate synthase [Flavobacteriales bacterium]